MSLTPWIEVKNGLSEILKRCLMILYGADLRLHYCFVVKSGAFYLLYALACFRNQCDCHFSIRSLTELVNCGLLSELGVECLNGLWEDLSPYSAA